MKLIRLFSMLLAAQMFFCGCRALQSEFEKSERRKAGSTVVIDGTTFQLTSSLKRTISPDGKRSSVTGELTITTDHGSFPLKVNAYHLALRPDATGAYVMNFIEEKGAWVSVDDDRRSIGRFTGSTTIEPDRRIIHFSWQDLKGKPADFATFMVSVTLSDANQKRYLLTNLNVPTD